MSKKKSQLANLPLSFWVLMLLIVLSMSCFVFLMDEANRDALHNGKNGIEGAKMTTATAALQELYDRSQRGEISVAYAKLVGADIIEGAELCAETMEGEAVVACPDSAQPRINMNSADFEPFSWVIMGTGK
ncbi:MAG: hypothetical protein WC323_01305 [Patescibacteria group bacterium]|jgi:hypothetical protein